MVSDPNALKTYRHKATGLVGVFPARLGDNDPHLKEVEPGAKPFAYLPIPPEAVEAAKGSRKVTSGERASSTNKKRK